MKEIPTVEAQLSDLLETLNEKPLHGSTIIKDAAHILLIQLLNFYQNFPCKEGIDILSSQVSELDDIFKDQIPLFYIYNDHSLFSFVEVAISDTETVARLILRDSTGKYAWDSRVNYKDPLDLLNSKSYSLLQSNKITNAPVKETKSSHSHKGSSSREPGALPKAQNANQGPPVDQLEELLNYLNETDPDYNEGKALNQPGIQVSAENVKQIEKILFKQEDNDKQRVQQLVEKNKSKLYDDWACLEPTPKKPTSPVHHCRLFLHHLGFLSVEKQAAFTMMEYNARFLRNLQLLDKTYGREMLKIGIIYVQEGQDDEKIILTNATKSPLYSEFISGLGWWIDILTHRGYLGGLDPKLTTGTHAPYYANSIMEVIFHDITSMPTNPTDNQQIHKKRHVGNDIVHIVYSEHTYDYLPTTIKSQFNDAHIIIYPLPNGLFRINVYRKENVQLFGPLLHGMCVNKQLLPILVRQTAINANRYVRYNTEGYSRPFPTRSVLPVFPHFFLFIVFFYRRKIIDEVIAKYKVQMEYEDLVGTLFGDYQVVPQEKATNNQ